MLLSFVFGSIACVQQGNTRRPNAGYGSGAILSRPLPSRPLQLPHGPSQELSISHLSILLGRERNDTLFQWIPPKWTVKSYIFSPLSGRWVAPDCAWPEILDNWYIAPVPLGPGGAYCLAPVHPCWPRCYYTQGVVRSVTLAFGAGGTKFLLSTLRWGIKLISKLLFLVELFFAWPIQRVVTCLWSFGFAQNLNCTSSELR